MKPARLIVLLAACNVLLLAVVFWQARLLRSTRGIESVAQAIESTGAVLAFATNPEKEEGRHESLSPPPSLVASSASARPALAWAEVEAPDYRSYIRNLRSVGVPEQTVRDIVTADVVKVFAPERVGALADRYRDFKFWETAPDNTESRAALMGRRREIDAAMGNVLDELLGPDVIPPSTENEWKMAELELQLSFLPPDRRDSARAVLLRYADIDAQVKSLADGRRPTEDAYELERIVELYETKRAELARLITPEEYEEVELTVSWTAENLRRAMANFSPTEEEFRVIFKAWRAHDEHLVHLYATHQPDPGNAHVFESIREVLGEERYAEYRRTWWK